MKKIIEMKNKAFTLVEMLVVLLIISVLLLLFVPNLSKHSETVQKKGNEAVVKIVESQQELYQLEHGHQPSAEELKNKGYITEKQLEQYQNAKK
ncbi:MULTISPECIES: competence type IV pilus major pilin ComGC [Streptococcus]|uniref:Competence protein ComG n=2 Tax=Streptococcus ruminantium TaxID=1917441 RepID=A0A2Z5TK63_9STRE|nr:MULTISPECIES: competence type IV pilus major pilin ComGC [Streptococcus]MDQ8759253.1 competence type IV pilus major pilin ComGC [Streptococcus ruminantium]MDQ8764204.1 competence type IV pilus major pilin ComGC [Streptococcus ruminantium]MDQ8766692.1 competence type IV pilus major pilin ComGC [Streptococcus ruminantium]MDQ8768318.1 competence type IV pilus major pilin ComGC [Streptococcus ruminantium]MDQ8775291.1 competence type IV pilus major pilin ComGC [Streptococcus ruminantium]